MPASATRDQLVHLIRREIPVGFGELVDELMAELLRESGAP